MPKKLEGKVAVITGGTEGIGFATAKLFVKEGTYVFITGRRQKELDEAVNAIRTNVSGVQGDVAQLADLDRLYEIICSLWGRHRRAFRQTIQRQCEGNAFHGAKGLTSTEGWWLYHSQRLCREC
jgi:NAD(P)-dependent dehydrogenase (short-subunit alcohol dehydrogenase family)